MSSSIPGHGVSQRTAGAPEALTIATICSGAIFPASRLA